jgi:hypothetical protein
MDCESLDSGNVSFSSPLVSMSFFFFFWDRVSSWSQAGLELTILLPQSSKCWDYNMHHHTLLNVILCGVGDWRETGVWIQDFILTKQALYCLSHDANPFCSGYFGVGISQTICPDWPKTTILPISVSQVARIAGISHWHPALCHSWFPSYLSGHLFFIQAFLLLETS